MESGPGHPPRRLRRGQKLGLGNISPCVCALTYVGTPDAIERWTLVVEDNLDDERLATRVFNRWGRTEKLVIARDGAEALKVLKANSPPTLVLLDLKLPRLSGVEVLMAIR